MGTKEWMKDQWAWHNNNTFPLQPDLHVISVLAHQPWWDNKQRDSRKTDTHGFLTQVKNEGKTQEWRNEQRNKGIKERNKEWRNEPMDEGMSEGMKEWTKEWTKEWPKEWTNEWRNEGTNKVMAFEQRNEGMNEGMKEWTKEWIKEWGNEWRNEWMNEQVWCMGYLFLDPNHWNQWFS